MPIDARNVQEQERVEGLDLTGEASAEGRWREAIYIGAYAWVGCPEPCGGRGCRD